MYSKLKVVNFKTDYVYGMNTTLESCMHIEMLLSLLTFNGDTTIRGLPCMIHDISKYKSVFWPIRRTSCHIFSNRILTILLKMYLNFRKKKLQRKMAVELKVLKRTNLYRVPSKSSHSTWKLLLIWYRIIAWSWCSLPSKCHLLLRWKLTFTGVESEFERIKRGRV